MPSASAKIEKVTSNEVTDPVKSFSSMLEKRIRNLEKRKIKLDNYRSDVANGKELNEDQKIAVSKYGEVVTSLDMCRELFKSAQGIGQEHARTVKKLVKKEQLERQQHEIQRLQEAFIYSHFLSCFQNEDVRSDFLNGENGAVQLTSEQLSELDQLFKLIGPRPPTEQADITSHYHVLAENHIFLVEGKNKEIVGTTYKALKEILVKIKECGYFSRPSAPAEESEASSDELPEEQSAKIEVHPEEFTPQVTDSLESSSNAVYTEEIENNGCEEVQAEIPTSPSSAPLQEVLEQQGAFNFLQESQIDLDAPHMDPAVVAVHQIPPVPSVNFVSNSYLTVEENGKPVNGTHLNEAPVPQTVIPSATQPALAPVQHDFDPSHPIPTQTFTNQSFAVMQNMMMPQAYVPVTLHHPLPTTIAVISPTPPTGVHLPVAVGVTEEIQDFPKSENQPQVNNEEDVTDVNGNANGVPEDKNKDNFNGYRGGYRGRGRGRGNYYRPRGNNNNYNGRNGYQNNYHRDRNGYNDNRERNGYNDNREKNGYNDTRERNGYNDTRERNGHNDTRERNGYNDGRDRNSYNDGYRRNNRGRGNGNNRGRGNYRSDAPNQQRNNNYHQQKQEGHQEQVEAQQ